MNRRHLMTAVGSVGLLNSLAYPAAAQGSPVVGLSLPLTGPQAEVAKDLLGGYSVAFKSSGIGMLVLDDEFKPEKTVANIRTFAANKDVTAVSGIVGTPNAAAAIPVARELGMPIVGLRSGAQNLRDGKDGVYHLRSSYDDELTKIATVATNSGLTSLLVIHSDDAFGKGALATMIKAMADQKLAAPKVLSLDRELKNLAEVSEAARAFLASPSGAGSGIALLMIQRPMSELLRNIRLEHKLIHPVFAMSFVATRAVSEQKEPFMTGLGLVSAFPLPRDVSFRLSKAFRADIEAQKREDLLNSLTAFEGWFYGSVLKAAIRKGATRLNMAATLARGVLDIAGQEVAFDTSKVGFRYLRLLVKGYDGRLIA